MGWIKNIYQFYYQGFKQMTLGKTLWVIILVKLFIMFAVFRIFFFKDFLGNNFKTDQERSIHVIEEITN
ncbi:MAG: DUF4492 domain-containing protein [Bacteroidales bacterium]|nr:DUF4492 domain-containing protein [Bacteroidales bacterium]